MLALRRSNVVFPSVSSALVVSLLVSPGGVETEAAAVTAAAVGDDGGDGCGRDAST